MAALAVVTVLCAMCVSQTLSQEWTGTAPPGMLMPSFALPTLNAAPSDAVYTYDVRAARPLRPMVIFALNETDPFSIYMVTEVASVDAFLLQDPIPAVDTLFLSYSSDASRIQQTILDRMAQLGFNATHRALWLQCLVFANMSIPQLEAAAVTTNPSYGVLPRILAQWPSLTRQVLVQPNQGTTMTLVRLDGHFQWCNVVEWTNHSPSAPTLPWPSDPASLIYGDTKGCTFPPMNFTGSYAFVHQVDAETICTYEAVALWAVSRGATGVIIMAGPTESLRQIGENGFEDQGIWTGDNSQGFCSMIPYDGALLAIAEEGAPLGLQYLSAPRPGAMTSMDSRGRLVEVGAAINPELLILGYHAQMLEYQANLHLNLSRPAYVIPLLDTSVGTWAQANVTAPAASFLSQFSDASLDATLSCTGMSDLDCDMWDHIVTITLHCLGAGKDSPVASELVWQDDHAGASQGRGRGAPRVGTPEPHSTQARSRRHGTLRENAGDPNEIGRWVTPYRRRYGRWLTSATLVLAIMAQGGPQCAVAMGSADNGSPWVFTLRLRLSGDSASTREAAAAPVPFARLPAFNTTLISTFDSGYNTRAVLGFTVPAQTRRALFTAFITGHGAMEFQASRHSFLVNGVAFNVSFMEPLDQRACAEQTRLGVEANGHGAWWYGRDGWCNGWPVAPWTVDVRWRWVRRGPSVRTQGTINPRSSCCGADHRGCSTWPEQYPALRGVRVCRGDERVGTAERA